MSDGPSGTATAGLRREVVALEHLGVERVALPEAKGAWAHALLAADAATEVAHGG